jgi:catalase
MVPGLAPTLDPMLQARMFAYPDAARYRVGANYQQLPCNRAVSAVYSPYERDGAMRFESNYGGDPSYVQSQLRPINFKGQLGANGYSTGHWDTLLTGKITGYTSTVDEDDFEQARMMWGVLKKNKEEGDFVINVVDSLQGVIPDLQKAAVGELVRISWRADAARHVHKGRPCTRQGHRGGSQGLASLSYMETRHSVVLCRKNE